MLSINIDTKGFENFMGALPEKLERELRIEMKNQLVGLQEEAMKDHRYETHTRKLEESVQWKISSDGKVGEVYLDDSIADYGKWVIRGHGTWAPDEFLEKALTKREEDIRKGFEEAVERAVK
jgi:hypothetical protein